MEQLNTYLQQLSIKSIHCRCCAGTITSQSSTYLHLSLCNTCYNNYINFIEEIDCSCITCGNSFATSIQDEAECPQCIEKYGMSDM